MRYTKSIQEILRIFKIYQGYVPPPSTPGARGARSSLWNTCTPFAWGRRPSRALWLEKRRRVYGREATRGSVSTPDPDQPMETQIYLAPCPSLRRTASGLQIPAGVARPVPDCTNAEAPPSPPGMAWPGSGRVPPEVCQPSLPLPLRESRSPLHQPLLWEVRQPPLVMGVP